MAVRPGDAAEEEVLKLVREYFPSARRSKASGAVHGDADIDGVPGVLIEVKDQTRGTGFTLRKEELGVVASQAANHGKEWVIITRNKDGDLIASCDLGLLLLALSHVPPGTI